MEITPEQALINRRLALQNNIMSVVDPELIKGKPAQQGEQREWNGKKFKKVDNKWVPVGEGKSSNEQQSPSTSNSVGKHETAQLTHMKSLVESDPVKAYEIFQSLAPETQDAVPQDVVDKLVQSAYKEGDQSLDYDKLGDDGVDKSQKLVGKHYKDMSLEELQSVAKIMKVKLDDKMSLSKIRTAVGDAIVDQKIQEAIKTFKDGKSNKK